MIDTTQLQGMNADELRALALELMSAVQAQQHIVDRTEAALRFSDAKLAQLTHEMAVLKRWKFAARSEKLGHEQQSLLDETIDADLAAIELELERLTPRPKAKDAPNKPRRAPLPANLPRQLVASFRLVPNLSGSRARRGFLMGGSGSVKVQIYGRGE
ncbi:transposase [Caballeronia sp. SBC2]|uniref:transposase n=1 Tax=Caballeronia sp. SBC2 TaxID=2705547 RepID=UPI0013E1583B|nr:transposase [Caballeronia sp. SBC2]QIE29703.1 Transposase C of IS166 homeodomain protein [Caballeronia sp. SBC2]